MKARVVWRWSSPSEETITFLGPVYPYAKAVEYRNRLDAECEDPCCEHWVEVVR